MVLPLGTSIVIDFPASNNAWPWMFPSFIQLQNQLQCRNNVTDFEVFLWYYGEQSSDIPSCKQTLLALIQGYARMAQIFHYFLPVRQWAYYPTSTLSTVGTRVDGEKASRGRLHSGFCHLFLYCCYRSLLGHASEDLAQLHYCIGILRGSSKTELEAAT